MCKKGMFDRVKGTVYAECRDAIFKQLGRRASNREMLAILLDNGGCMNSKHPVRLAKFDKLEKVMVES
ncbi:hypothetical protein CMI37_28935 [Candidatus Pacearchaeota archaeon]|nr:hypothetical protein [Candidatus Pacearchaeota archaeon]